MDDMVRARRYAVVTGASSGIGRELASLLAREGYGLVLVARRTGPMRELAEQLQQAHGVPSVVVGADLAAPEGVSCVVNELKTRQLDVEVLVNNAGFGLAGTFVDVGEGEPTALARELEMLQVNVVALTHLSKLFLPGMVERKRGFVMNVASTAAFQPGPLMAVYYASKAYVLSFSEALSVELDGTGVTVTALCPGATRTEFQVAAGMENSRLFRGGQVMTAGEVADAGYAAMRAGKPVVITGAANRVMAFSTRLIPRRMAARVAKMAQQNA